MTHVCHILTDTNIAGAGKLVYQLVTQSRREEFRHTILLPDNSALIALFQQTPAEILPVHGLYDRSWNPGDFRTLFRIFRKLKPDTVSANACLSGRMAARLAGVPVRIFTRHCIFDPPAFVRSPFLRFCNGRFQMFLSNRILAVSEHTADELARTGIPRERIGVVLNQVAPLTPPSPDDVSALRESLHLPERAFVIGTMARLEPYKGISELLDAFARLREECPDLVLLCPGEGSQSAFLKEKAARIDAQRVLFPGFTDTPALWFSLYQVHINNSYGTETASLSISEAASLGIPTIASTFGGNPELVRDGENGLLIPVLDTEALVSAIRSLYRDPELLQRLKKGARKAFEARPSDEMIRKTESYWKKS